MEETHRVSTVRRVESGVSTTRTPLPTLNLDRRAGDRTVGAEDTTISGLWLKGLPTLGALVEPLARVCRHDFGAGVPTQRAGKDRLKAGD